METPKGEYLFVRRMIPGRATRDILAEILPKLVADLPWPKSMRWGSRGFPFVRPIHWIVALFDGSVIPFELAGIRSGNRTRGHRFMAPGDVEVSGVEDYLRKVEKGRVIIRPEERMKQVETAVLKAAEAVSGNPVIDPELLSTVTNMVEYPTAVCGGFDAGFLAIPGSRPHHGHEEASEVLCLAGQGRAPDAQFRGGEQHHGKRPDGRQKRSRAGAEGAGSRMRASSSARTGRSPCWRGWRA